MSGHRDGDFRGAGTDREQTECSGHRRVAVRAEQELPRPGEALEMKIVRDAVAGTRVEGAVPLGPAPQVRVVLGVLVVDLKDVVVDVGDGWNRDPIEAELLELEARHRARRVLEQDLVDEELDLLLRASGEVFGDDLLREGHRFGHVDSVNVLAVLFAALAGALFGALAVTVRY